MKKILFLFLLACANLANAQYLVDYKKVADAYFEQKNYYAASTFYKKALNITTDSAQVYLPYSVESNSSKKEKGIKDYESIIFNLAESSRLYKEYTDAEKYYAIASKFSDKRYKNALFYYGESLMSNKKYDEAISTLNQFIKNNQNDVLVNDARKEIESCKFALNEIKYPRMVQLKKMPYDLNGLGSNYALVKINNDFCFTSSRPISVANKRSIVKTRSKEVQISTKANPFVSNIYLSEGTSGDKISVKRIGIVLPKNMETATPAFSPDGNTLYFTAWIGKEKFAIYSSNKIDNKWSAPKLLGSQINGNDWTTSQPFVTKDGKYLLFSSDRLGGYGKTDIWYSIIRGDGSLSEAVNLGPVINTTDDERAPSYNSITKKLIFSSNGRVGLGGLDFFESEGDFVNWSTPKNLGYPFNSPKHDVYFTPIDELGTRGYISSDRESSCCVELFEIKRESLRINGTLTDCKTNKPIAGVKVILTNSDGEQQNISDDSGKYNFSVDSKRPIKLQFSKENYFSTTKDYTYERLAKADTLISEDYCLSSYKVNAPIVLENVYYEFNSAELTESSKKVLDELVVTMNNNPNIKIELGAHTDNKGTDMYNLDLSERRAKSCVLYLASKNIPISRLTYKGYGKTMPIAPNTTPDGKDNPEGRAKNRRTEVKVTNN